MATDGDDITRYREGSMPDAERHALEKKALDDPFLADALEGAESLSPSELKSDLRDIDGGVLRKSQKPVLTPMRIAAGVVILLGASLFYFFDSADPALIAEQATPAKVTDSLKASPDTTSQLLTLATPEEPSAGEPAARKDARRERAAEKPAAVSGPVAATTDEKQPEAEAEVESAQVEDSRTDEGALAKGDKESKKEAVSESQPVTEAAGASRSLESRSLSADKAAVAKSKSAVSGRVITGKVTTAEDGLPLPGVNVMVKGSNRGTVTDLHGRYQLSGVSEGADLVFSFIGLHTQEVPAGSRDVVDVRLDEDVSQLSEVVVTGYGSNPVDDDREPVIKMASPAGGLRAYNRYLESNLRYPKEAVEKRIKGKVTVQFTVETNGQLSDFNVLKSLGYGCDDEVIRLVKEGPRWNPTTKDDVPLESEVRVKLKFDPDKADR